MVAYNVSLLVHLIDYGLRDYGTATWEGGDSRCDHLAPPRGRRNPETAMKQLTNVGTLNYQYNSICGKCGATRIDSQIGLEETPDDYVQKLVDVFREVKRVLRDDGTVWLNLGDSYNGSGGPGSQYDTKSAKKYKGEFTKFNNPNKNIDGLKPKDLIGIPWRVAFALQADGWYLRSDIIWSKSNPMPESVKDRPTRSHEYMFLLTKNKKYYYDNIAVQDPAKYDGRKDTIMKGSEKYKNGYVPNQSPQTVAVRGHERWLNKDTNGLRMRNARTVWTINTKSYKEAHFATYPPALVEPCVKAGTSEKGCCPICGAPWKRISKKIGKFQRRWSTNNADGSPYNKQDSSQNIYETIGWEPTCSHIADPVPCLVLDPFNGSGTTGEVSVKLNRSYVGIELKLDYIELSKKRLEKVQLVLQ